MKKKNSTLIVALILVCSFGAICCGEGTSKSILDKVVNKMVTKDPENHAYRIVAAFRYFDAGYFSEAEKHFNKASELTPDDPYDRAWLHMAQLRQNPKASGKALKSFLDKNKSTDFIYTNIKLLLGEISPEDAIKQAIASKDQGNVCEAYYYAAQRFLVDGQEDMAKKCFNKSTQTKKETYWEYTSSVAGLKSLK